MEEMSSPNQDCKFDVMDKSGESVIAESHRISKNEETKSPVNEENKASSGGLAKLTAEQLLDYVKKQNLKMKKLKGENEAQLKTISDLTTTISDLKLKSKVDVSLTDSSVVDGNGYNLFWDLIDRRPLWQQKLAKLSLLSMVCNLSKINPMLGKSSSVRRSFQKWALYTQNSKIGSIQSNLDESKKANSLLEQRVAKLKSLLARMHQSNQKSQEYSVSARQGQLEAAQELRQRVDKEEAQNRALAEQLRCLSFESAFHTDIELAIEKAAQTIAAQTSSHNNSAEQLQSTKALEHLQMTVTELTGQLEEQTSRNDSLSRSLREQTSKVKTLETSLELLQNSVTELQNSEALLRRQLSDERAVSGDMELELQIVMSQQIDRVAEAERIAADRYTEMVAALQASVDELQARLEAAERRALISEQREERSQKDLVTARSRLAGLHKVQVENDKLSSLVRELKRGGAGGGEVDLTASAASVDSARADIESRLRQQQQSCIDWLRNDKNIVLLDRRVLEYLLDNGASMWEKLNLSVGRRRRLENTLHKCCVEIVPKLSTVSDMCLALAHHDCSLLQSVTEAFVSRAVAWLDQTLGVDLLVQQKQSHENSSQSSQDLFENSAVAQLLHCVTNNISAFDELILSGAASSQYYEDPNGRSLLRVYFRVLKKTNKLQHQLQQLKLEQEVLPSTSLLDENASQEDPRSEVPLASESGGLVPHHLDYEASEISLSSGAEIHLPLPMPRPAPSDLASPLEVAASVRFTWVIRGSKGALSALRLTLSPMGGTTSAGDFISIEGDSSLVSNKEYEDIVLAAPDPSDHKHHKNDPSAGLTHVLYGQYVVETRSGDQLLSIRNAAMWSAAVLSYSIRLQNNLQTDTVASLTVSEHAPESPPPETQQSEKKEADAAVAAERDRVAAEMSRLEHGIAALHGPLLTLRERLRAGASLRETVLAQYEQWRQLQQTEAEVNTRLRHEQDRLVHYDIWNSSDNQKSCAPSVRSRWNSDLAAIRRIALDLEVSDAADVLTNARSLSTKLLLRAPSSVVSRSATPDTANTDQSTCSVHPSNFARESSLRSSTVSRVQSQVQPGRAVFSSARLKVPPGGDFRCPLRLENMGGGYVLSWDFTLLSGENASSAEHEAIIRGKDRGSDVGFSIIGRTAEGFLPLLIPYRRIGPEGRTHVGSVRLRLVGVQEGMQWDADASAVSPDKDNELCVPFREVIVLFDNTYSWFKPKFIRYDISLDFQPDDSDATEQQTGDSLIGQGRGILEKQAIDSDIDGGVLERAISVAADSAHAVAAAEANQALSNISGDCFDPEEEEDDENQRDLEQCSHLATAQQRAMAIQPVNDLSSSVADSTQGLIDAVEDIYVFSKDVMPLLFK